jgi:hypothetical protein
MPETEGDAQLGDFLRGEIPRLALLYDRFAHAIDPYARERDIAEQTFGNELAAIYDNLPGVKPPFQEFRRFIITRCRRHLKASDKPPTT